MGGGAGWFSASYGPFRRFTGGDKDQEKLYYTRPKLARLSVFGESVALSKCLEWLKLLQFKKLEKDPEGDLLEPLVGFINQPGFQHASLPVLPLLFAAAPEALTWGNPLAT